MNDCKFMILNFMLLSKKLCRVVVDLFGKQCTAYRLSYNSRVTKNLSLDDVIL